MPITNTQTLEELIDEIEELLEEESDQIQDIIHIYDGQREYLAARMKEFLATADQDQLEEYEVEIAEEFIERYGDD